jgi:hypothetical protein
MPAFSHLPIGRTTRLSPILCSTNPKQPLLAHRVEERSDIGVQYEVHFAADDTRHQCIHRIV